MFSYILWSKCWINNNKINKNWKLVESFSCGAEKIVCKPHGRIIEMQKMRGLGSQMPARRKINLHGGFRLDLHRGCWPKNTSACFQNSRRVESSNAHAVKKKNHVWFLFQKISQRDEQTVAGDKMDSKNMILNFGKQEWIPLCGLSKSPLIYLNGKVWTCRTIWFDSASCIFKAKPTSRSQTDGKHTKSIIWGWNGDFAAFHVLIFFPSAMS